MDPNQELIAMGASNIFGTFFQSLPMTASMSRTMVQVSAGGRTLMASVVSIFMLLWVLLFAGPLFRDLPNCILAALIMVSLRGILMQFKDVKIYAKRSNSEIFVWLSTFLGTVFVDIDYGLIIGLGVTFIFLLWWGYYPKVELLSPTDHEDLFTNKSEVREYKEGKCNIIYHQNLFTLLNKSEVEEWGNNIEIGNFRAAHLFKWQIWKKESLKNSNFITKKNVL